MADKNADKINLRIKPKPNFEKIIININIQLNDTKHVSRKLASLDLFIIYSFLFVLLLIFDIKILFNTKSLARKTEFVLYYKI